MKKKKMGYWKDWSIVESKLRRFIEQNNGIFPVTSQFRKWGEESLLSAIANHHGGLSDVRVKMGYINGHGRYNSREHTVFYHIAKKDGKYFLIDRSKMPVISAESIEGLAKKVAESRYNNSSSNGHLNSGIEEGLPLPYVLIGYRRLSERDQETFWRSYEETYSSLDGVELPSNIDLKRKLTKELLGLGL